MADEKLTLQAPEDVAPRSIIGISDPLPDGTTYRVRQDGTVEGVSRAHFEQHLKPIGYKEIVAPDAAAQVVQATPGETPADGGDGKGGKKPAGGS